MPEDEAIAFLQARSGRRDEAGARSLVRTLGGFPLALDHAGAFVRSAILSFDAYGHSLEKFLARAPKDAPYPASVAATFSIGHRECRARMRGGRHGARPSCLFRRRTHPAGASAAIADPRRTRAPMHSWRSPAFRSCAASLCPMTARPFAASIGAGGDAAAACRARQDPRGLRAGGRSRASRLFPSTPTTSRRPGRCCDDLLAHGLAIRRHALDLGTQDGRRRHAARSHGSVPARPRGVSAGGGTVPRRRIDCRSRNAAPRASSWRAP